MTPQERFEQRLQRLNRKGMGVANKLADLMAGKDITLGEIGLSGVDMIDNKEQRLRGFLGMINDSRKILRGPDYLTKIGAEDPKQQAWFDENPWMEAAKPEVASEGTGHGA